jgi:Flp pilus assembly protein TadD
VTALAYWDGGARLATGALDSARDQWEVRVWDLASWEVVKAIAVGRRPISAVALSADGRMVAAGGGDGQSGISGWAGAWEAETGKQLVSLDGGNQIMSLAFHPDGTRLAAADFGNEIWHLWDLVAGTKVEWPAPPGVSCLAFMPDGTRLASVGYDGQVHLADSRTGEELLVLRSGARSAGPFGFTPRLAFSPDGSRIAANGFKEVSFWESLNRPGPGPEPTPVDIVGWLRQGRALVEAGDASGAAAAYARAQVLEDRDPSPWLEHALALFRRGDSVGAGKALARAMNLLPEDAGRWADLGLVLERFGRTRESQTALAKAQALSEKRLSAVPDDEAAAAVLAVVLPDAGPSREWTTLEPTSMSSAGGATLTRMGDGSVVVSGRSPAVDTYTIEAAARLTGIAGLRLEALAEAGLPHRGPGRCPSDGNFVIDGIRLSTLSGPNGAEQIRLKRACADHSDRTHGLQGVTGAVDENTKSAWSIWPQVGRSHVGVFEAAKTCGIGPGTRLRVELVSGRPDFPQRTLGRFRLAVTNRPVPLFELSLARIKSGSDVNGLTRVGAAYYLLGDWDLACSALSRAAARSDATALAGFLLALARHRLGRLDEARNDCQRALGRLRTDRSCDETSGVALEALVVIRGVSVRAAEALMLDAVFPADPFGR